MARHRSIKPDFFVSDQILKLSRDARLLFIGLWCFSDDRGVHPDGVVRLRAEVFPVDGDVAPAIDRWLEELVEQKLVRRFVCEAGSQYLAVTGWAKHQKIDRPTFKYPPPPMWDGEENGSRWLDESSATIRRGLDEGSTSPRRGLAPEKSRVERSGVSSRARAREADDDGKGKAAGEGGRGTRIPADHPGVEERAFAAGLDLSEDQIDKVAARYRDFWLAKAGPNGVKRDWLATWRNWLRKEIEEGRLVPAGRKANGKALDVDERLMRSRASTIQTANNKNFARDFAIKLPRPDLRRMVDLGLVTRERLAAIGLSEGDWQ